MSAKNNRINGMLSQIAKRELAFEQDPETDIALLLSEVRSNLRVDLITKELLSLGCVKHKIIRNLTMETIDSLFRSYNLYFYGVYYYDETIDKSNWMDSYIINNDIRHNKMRQWAVDELLNIIQRQKKEGGERTYLCTRKDGTVLLYYYGRDYLQMDYVFVFSNEP